ncbi:MAG: ester cyclase [Actinomycetota bacterium]
MLGLLRQLGIVPGGDGDGAGSDDDVVPGEGDPDASKQVVRRFHETTWNAGDLEAARGLLDDDLVDRDPLAFPGRGPGPDGLLGVVTAVRGAFSEFRRTIEDQIAEGDLVVTRFTDRCIHTGEFLQIPATGKAVIVAGTNIERVAGGRITEVWHIEDLAGMMQQLGVA